MGSAIAQDSGTIRQKPERLNAGQHGIGRMIPDLAFTDVGGTPRRLSEIGQNKALVIAMTGTGCPLCLKYSPSIADIEKRYLGKGVAFVFVNPIESERGERIRKAIRTHGFQGTYVVDDKEQITRTLGAATTTEVFVLDRARTLVYRGAVDDQYGLGYSLNKPQHNYLTDALDAVLAGTSPTTQATSAPGCELGYDATDAVSTGELTYHNRISRIVQANCLECHRNGGTAPMAFESYSEVKDYVGMIGNVVRRGVMPPWFASEGQSVSNQNPESRPTHWANDRSLSESEKADLFKWIKSGTPEGDPGNAPLPRSFPDGWLIGQPDAEYEFPSPVKVKADGVIPYKYVTVETNLPEDRWVQAIEIRPGNINVVHHVLVSVRGDDGEFDEGDGYWAVYVPGNSKIVFPDGYARRMPKGARLRFQMHYTPNGTATEDSTRIGVVFAPEPPKHEVKVHGIANQRFTIPAGAVNHELKASIKLPSNVQVLSFLPHMHLRGKAARYELISSNPPETLLDIPDYDFNWQLNYQLAKPRPLSAGDTIRYTAWYDNSSANPANPDPTQAVKWGPQTFDEMHLGYIEYVVSASDSEKLSPKPGGGQLLRRGRRLANGAFFARLDADRDGFVTRQEVRKKLPGNQAAATTIFDRLDMDRNGKLDSAELDRLP